MTQHPSTFALVLTLSPSLLWVEDSHRPHIPDQIEVTGGIRQLSSMGHELVLSDVIWHSVPNISLISSIPLCQQPPCALSLLK